MKILVVDDETHIRTLLKITLEMVGYEVDMAGDGQEALDKIEGGVPDLVLLDIKMPILNGWQVCEKIKSEEKTRNIPVIMVTAFGQTEARQRSLDLGADEFIPKPFETSTLLDAIKKLLNRSRP